MPIRARENLIGAWAFLIGLILAVIAGLLAPDKIRPAVLIILAVLGLIVGYFVSEREVKTFLIASASLVLVSFAGIQGIVLESAIRGIAIGQFVSGILGALLVLFVPATIVVAIKTVFAISTLR